MKKYILIALIVIVGLLVFFYSGLLITRQLYIVTIIEYIRNVINIRHNMITFLLIEKGKITMLFNNKELQSNFDIGKDLPDEQANINCLA